VVGRVRIRSARQLPGHDRLKELDLTFSAANLLIQSLIYIANQNSVLPPPVNQPEPAARQDYSQKPLISSGIPEFCE
jgi:hypothetical protein